MRALLNSMGGLPLAVILLALLFQEWDPNGAARAIQNFGFDRYIAASPWENSQDSDAFRPDLLYVELDHPPNKDTNVPWPRTDIANLVNTLSRAGAEAVLFDAPFAQPDPASPSRIADALTQQNVPTFITDAVRKLPNPDDALSSALVSVQSLAAIELSDKVAVTNMVAADPMEFDGDNPAKFLFDYQGAYSDAQIFAATAEGSGVVTIPSNTSGLVRQMPLIFQANESVLPSLALELMRRFQDAPIIVRSGPPDLPFTLAPSGIQKITVGSHNLTTDRGGAIWLHPPGPSASIMRLGSDILSDGLPPQSLDNTIVFIGVTPAERSRLRMVNGQSVSRAQLQLLAFDQMISGHFVDRPDWALRAEQLYILVFGLMIWAAAVYTGLSISAVVASLSIALPAYFGLVIFETQLLLIDFIIPCTTLILIFITTAAWRAVQEEWVSQLTGVAETNAPRASFRSRIARSAHMETTVLVCSVRNMGGLTQQYAGSPFAVGAIISKAFATISPLISLHGGAIIQRGDTLVAIWYTPNEPGSRATQACECSLSIVERLEDVNAKLEKEFAYDGLSFDPITLNIGLASGYCAILKPKRKSSTNLAAYGAPLSIASELCRQAERYGPAILLEENTARLEGHQLAHLPIDSMRMNATSDPFNVFALSGNAFMRANPRFRDISQKHRQIFAAVQSRLWEDAGTLVEECKDLPGASPILYDFYAEKVAVQSSFGVNATTPPVE